MTRILVAIVTFNSAATIDACLRSLRGSGDILVFDNGSSEEERHALEGLVAAYPRVTLHLGSENLGFGSGVNRAVELLNPTDNDLVWILNPDTVVEPNAAYELSSAIIGQDADLVAPLIYSGDPTSPRIWFAGGSVCMPSGIVRHVEEAPAGIAPAQFLTGAAIMLSGATWRKLGGFREDLFLYWEDVELCLRASHLGLRMACAPRAIIHHAEGGSSRRGKEVRSPLFYYYVQRNRLLVARMRGHLFDTAFGSGFFETMRLTLRPPLREPASRLRGLALSVLGLNDGLRGVQGKLPEKRR